MPFCEKSHDMSPVATALVTAAVSIVALMLLTWIISVICANASIVDIVWGLGFVVVAWTVRWRVDEGLEARQWLLVAMTSVWGLRLAGYLFWRNHGNGEDFRYRAMRKHWGPNFRWISLVTVFGVQGLLMWVVSLPVQLGQTDDTPDLGPLAWIGVAVWLIGLCFEVVGDAQLARFKANPGNAGIVMDTGLWRYTRHPNYFGDACVWWGIALVAAETGTGAWGLIGALVMTVLLRRVSGVTLLEKSLVKRRAGYVEYVAQTSPFIPRPPRRPR
jgi:steroid 5-alpha reductase family enzyme